MVKAIEEEEIVTTNVRPMLKIITGGKDGDFGNWIAGLPKGSAFIVHEKLERMDATIFQVAFHFRDHTLLYNSVNQPFHRLVNQVEFCRRYDLDEVLQYGEAPPDGDSIEHRQSDLAHDVDAQEGQPEHDSHKPE